GDLRGRAAALPGSCARVGDDQVRRAGRAAQHGHRALDGIRHRRGVDRRDPAPLRPRAAVTAVGAWAAGSVALPTTLLPPLLHALHEAAVVRGLPGPALRGAGGPLRPRAVAAGLLDAAVLRDDLQAGLAGGGRVRDRGHDDDEAGDTHPDAGVDPEQDEAEPHECAHDADDDLLAVGAHVASGAVHLRGKAGVLGPDGLFHLLEHLPLTL